MLLRSVVTEAAAQTVFLATHFYIRFCLTKRGQKLCGKIHCVAHPLKVRKAWGTPQKPLVLWPRWCCGMPQDGSGRYGTESSLGWAPNWMCPEEMSLSSFHPGMLSYPLPSFWKRGFGGSSEWWVIIRLNSNSSTPLLLKPSIAC